VTATLAFTAPLSCRADQPDVVRLVVYDGLLCNRTCPHLSTHIDAFECDGLGQSTMMLRVVSGTPERCMACRTATSDQREYQVRAERALQRLRELQARKAQMKTETKTQQTNTKASGRPADVRIQKDTRHLKIALSREEIEERAERAAYTWAEMQKQEAEMKAVASAFKARISELEGKLNALQQQVRDRCAYGDVDCDIVFDFKTKEVYTIRLDTKDEIERRDMRRDEMQEKFEFKEPETPARPADVAVSELNEEGDRTASELRARAKKSKKV